MKIQVTKYDTLEFAIDKDYVADKIRKALEKWRVQMTFCEDDFEQIIEDCVKDL
jgi:hypothetical protein